MNDNIEKAESALRKLLQSDEDQLYEEIGIRMSAMSEDSLDVSEFDPTVTIDVSEMGPLDDLRELGRRMMQRWNRSAHELVCGTSDSDSKDRKTLLEAFGAGEIAVGVALATLLVSHLAITPAIASVIAALVMKRFFTPAYEEFCSMWETKLDS
jgi:hypothetical protein